MMDIRRIENQIIYKEDKKNRIKSSCREDYPDLADNPKVSTVNDRGDQGTVKKSELINDIRK